MASFIDLMSSPDPLIDEEIPSSMRRSTRRTANSSARSQYSSLFVPETTPRTRVSSTGKSPRKQTFELDVGNELAPQRILVTVEAEDFAKSQGATSRRLFTSSPSRSVSRRRETGTTTTTTTTVPLRGLTDDEGGDNGEEAPTPRRRGRPPGSKNATPNPRGKKRAGTPMRKTPAQRQQRHGDAESEASIFGDALMETDGNVGTEAMSKLKSTAKRPKKAATPVVPSSQPTGRKRGRPRKASMPQEVAILTDAISEAEDKGVGPNMLQEQTGGEGPSEASTTRTKRPEGETHATEEMDAPTLPSFDSPPQPDINYTFTEHDGQRPESGQEPEPNEASGHEARWDGGDADLFEDFMTEPHSDLESLSGQAREGTYNGQDNNTLDHASDFSMIAVESLPSFQASFQSNQSGLIPGYHDADNAGDETNMMINQTMASLRNSTHSQSEMRASTQSQSALRSSTRSQSGQETGDTVSRGRIPAYQSSPMLPGNMAAPDSVVSSRQAWSRSPSRSPRRQKQTPLPLSRQVFVSKAPATDPRTEDSFSSVPDSVLKAATPRRLTMKPTDPTTENKDTSMYDDSFSEIPDEVLEAATPRPRPRPAIQQLSSQDESPASSTAGREATSASKTANSFGSSRLPTPDDTSSSAAGSKNTTQDGMTQHVDESQAAIPNTSDLNIRSSPPAIKQTISKPIQTEQDLAGTPSPPASSPPLPAARSESPDLAQAQGPLLQPPAPVRRPTLSPIVRVGRTLQSVMTDRSSPDGRESSLGSPFRGSSVVNESRQSSVAKSPNSDGQTLLSQNGTHSTFNAIASFAQSIKSNFSQSQSQLQATGPRDILGNVEDPFGPDMHGHSQTESLRMSAYDQRNQGETPRPGQPIKFPLVTSSTRAAPATSDDMGSAANESSPAQQKGRRLSISRPFHSINSSLFGTRGSNGTQVMDFGVAEDSQGAQHIEERGDPETNMEDANDLERQDEVAYEAEDDSGNRSDDEGEEEEVDLWDIEASRSTPRPAEVVRAEAQARRQSQGKPQGQVQTKVPPPRRSKLPSPWRKSTRRLIYQDEVRSPAQIEIEAEYSPESVGDDEFFLLKEIANPTAQPKAQEAMEAARAAEYEPEDYPIEARHDEEIPESEGHEMVHQQEEDIPEPADYRTAVEQDEDTPEPADYGIAVEQDEDTPEPENYSKVYEQYDVMPEPKDHPMPHQQDDDLPGFEDHLMSPQQDDIPEPENYSKVSRHQDRAKPQQEARERSDITQYSMLSEREGDTEEYSMVPKQKEKVPTTQEKPASAKSRFSAFNILSFFSSPAPLPQGNGENAPKAVAKPTPRTRPAQNTEEPRSVLRAPGLFPSIPQKFFNPSPERRVDLFSPGSALKSNDTVADTYAPSPSTPERQEFPHIPQKQNFTPLSRQSRNTASLFTPSRQTTPVSPEKPSYDDDMHQPHGDQNIGESSILSVESEYERLPPRAKPSKWDRTLSPTKSCMRSPLKPRTPGRVVEFSAATLNPLAQAQMRTEQRNVPSLSLGNRTLSQNQPLLLPVVHEDQNKEKEKRGGTESRLSISNSSNSSNSSTTDFTSAPPSSAPSRNTRPKPSTSSTSTSNSKSSTSSFLSPTTWRKQHWVRLDEMLQLRRRDPLLFQQRCPLPTKDKRRTQAILGKEVSAQGERMILEPWHLDIVEAFRFEVGGWDERVLAKRLFALVVGEERRRKGIIKGGERKKLQQQQ
ncbi:uncharacterized protein BCR38DRAFT_491232 [Pseudomassariella vexata]|uniref:Uncharacterized protein n=1 Tax=Pseudomassariella vexata TaxID=1141098 RepID=A0A1Y2D716_9PEZI|nr:uncharacterized protein BCR38DRAFT_491232 [Pseudomassariella vexata]ORY55080.1 hypothetical protein BCR38DRAFT_491232 [Pseudomassariella vexata]